MYYVMSDIHGYYGRYKKMLEKINFSEKDSLYIIGDVIDRGPNGIDVIKDIMKRKNVILLLGNHEHMMIDYIENNKQYIEGTWFYNGGHKTMYSFEKCSDEEKKRIMNFLKNLTLQYTITINNKQYWLCHGYPVFDRNKFKSENYYIDTVIWERIECGKYPSIPDNITVIFGHTPTSFMQKNEPFAIWHEFDNLIGIDCGLASSDSRNRKLACICLDTMEEFYV